mmetsp:Transcript_18781/g.45219  ORF Transcript_18781/g.45219 Transcript_18781/m.45219 type:complete len:214 (+) Transcript_18781:680-1321(+)
MLSSRVAVLTSWSIANQTAAARRRLMKIILHGTRVPRERVAAHSQALKGSISPSSTMLAMTCSALEWSMRAAAPERSAPGAPARTATTSVRHTHHQHPTTREWTITKLLVMSIRTRPLAALCARSSAKTSAYTSGWNSRMLPRWRSASPPPRSPAGIRCNPTRSLVAAGMSPEPRWHSARRRSTLEAPGSSSRARPHTSTAAAKSSSLARLAA